MPIPIGHEIHTKDGWKKVEDLKNTDKIANCKNKMISFNKNIIKKRNYDGLINCWKNMHIQIHLTQNHKFNNPTLLKDDCFETMYIPIKTGSIRVKSSSKYHLIYLVCYFMCDITNIKNNMLKISDTCLIRIIEKLVELEIKNN